MKNASATTRVLAAAALVLGGLAAASTAQARSDVHFSIGLNLPGVYAQPAPVYYPSPYYVRPAPVYVQPAPVYYGGRGPWGDRDRDGVPNAYDRYDNRFDSRHGNRHHVRPHGGPRPDLDRDGVPNRHDRFPGNPYYR